MKHVYEVIKRPTTRTRPWWDCVEPHELETRVKELSDHDLEVAYHELKSAVSSCGLRASDTTVEYLERRRARTALRYLVAKRNIAKTEMVRRNMCLGRSAAE